MNLALDRVRNDYEIYSGLTKRTLINENELRQLMR
jgi:hypothetical protein